MNEPLSKPLYQSIQSLNLRPLRDLAWALLSTPVFLSIPRFPKDCLDREYVDDDLWPWLESVDREPAEFIEHMEKQRSSRLGIYFEQLLSFYFEYYPADNSANPSASLSPSPSRRFTLLAKNLQVSDGTRTLGEFDFIVQDNQTQSVYHIEAALKFYLGYSNYPQFIKGNAPHYNWHHWVGPNQKDTLAIKMQHLKHRQIDLSQTDEGRLVLEKLGVNPDNIQQRLFYMGRFYFPLQWKLNGPAYSNPMYSNKASDNCCWTESKHFLLNKSITSDQNQYCILPRDYWLSSLAAIDFESKDLTLLTANELHNKINDDLGAEKTEWQVVELTLEDSLINEVKRFFIIKTAE